MNVLRRLGLALSIALFSASLVLLVLAVSLNHVLGTSGYIKRSLKESGVYTQLVDSITAQARQPAGESHNNSLPLEREEIRRAAREAFSPEIVQQSVETIVDGTYTWLEGKRDQPQFQVDLAPAKTDFANRIGTYARNRAADLPVCTRLPESINPFEITCRPPGVNLDPEIRRLTAELATTSQYLADPVITPEDLTINEGGKPVPYYQAGDEWPGIFARMRQAPFVLGALAALSAAAVIGLSRPPRRGLRHLSVALITAGITTLLGWWLFGWFTNSFGRMAGENSVHTTTFAQDVVAASLLGTLERALSGLVWLFGLLYLGLGIFCLVTTRLLARRRAGIVEPSQVNDKTNDAPPPPENPEK